MALTSSQIKQLKDRGLTDEQINKFTKQLERSEVIGREAPSPVEEATLGGFLKNIGFSTKSLFKDIGTAIANPLDTLKALGGITSGAVLSLPGVNNLGKDNFKVKNAREMFGDTVSFFKNRYLGADNLKRTLYEDPVGAALDVSGALGLTGKTAKALGKVSKAEKVVEAGEKITRVSRAVDPLELTFSGLGKAFDNKKIKLFAKSSDQEIRKIANKYNIDLPASALNNSQAVAFLDAGASKGLFGKAVNQIVDNANTAISSLANTISRRASNISDMKLVGETILEGLDDYKKVYENTKSNLYSVVEREAPTSITKAASTNSKLDELILKLDESFVRNPIKNEFIDIKNKIKKGATFKNLKETRSDIGRKLKSSDPVATGNKALYESLYASLSNDMDTALLKHSKPLYEQAKIANDYYKEGLGKINDTYVKKVQKLSNSPERIVNEVIKPSQISNVKKIMELVGEEKASLIRDAIISEIIELAKNKDGDIVGSRLKSAIKKWDDRQLRDLLTPEQYQSLKELEVLSEGIGNMKKISEASQTAFANRIYGELAVLFANPIAGLATFLGDAGLSKFMASETGRKLLSEGLSTEGLFKRVDKFRKISEKVAQPLFQAGRQEELQSQ